MACCVQFVPSQSQVSFRALVFLPPNMTVTPSNGLNAIACASRAGGLFARLSCVQFVPFHAHVSFRSCPKLSEPPKKMT